MLTTWYDTIFSPKALAFLVVFGFSGAATAQQVSLALLQPESIEAAAFVKPMEPVTMPEAPRHRFWDRTNAALFAANTALSSVDFVVTRNNLRNGGQELNPVTRVFSGSTAGLAVNFAGETAGVVAISYFFHRTGHHKLERAVSVVNIGSSTTAVVFDVAHH